MLVSPETRDVQVLMARMEQLDPGDPKAAEVQEALEAHGDQKAVLVQSGLKVHVAIPVRKEQRESVTVKAVAVRTTLP